MSADCLQSVFRAPSAAFMNKETRSPVFPAGISSRVRRRLSPDILFPYLPWVYLLTALGAWSTLPIPTLPGWGAASSKLLQVPPPWGTRPWGRDPSSRLCPPRTRGHLPRLLPRSKCLCLVAASSVVPPAVAVLFFPFPVLEQNWNQHQLDGKQHTAKHCRKTHTAPALLPNCNHEAHSLGLLAAGANTTQWQ